jgi:hypothetical protein
VRRQNMLWNLLHYQNDAARAMAVVNDARRRNLLAQHITPDAIEIVTNDTRRGSDTRHASDTRRAVATLWTTLHEMNDARRQDDTRRTNLTDDARHTIWTNDARRLNLISDARRHDTRRMIGVFLDPLHATDDARRRNDARRVPLMAAAPAPLLANGSARLTDPGHFFERRQGTDLNWTGAHPTNSITISA